MAGALEGIKVLDLTQVYSGPFCTMLLKDMGAEIIKIERPGSGDLTRSDVPHTEGMEGGAYITLNRGKKSVTLNLARKKALKYARSWLKKSMSWWRTSVPARWINSAFPVRCSAS